MTRMAISMRRPMRFLQEPTRTLRKPRERAKVTGRAVSQAKKLKRRRQRQLKSSEAEPARQGLMYLKHEIMNLRPQI